MTHDSSETEKLPNEFHSTRPTIHVDYGSLPGSPDFLEMELQYTSVSESPKFNNHMADLSPERVGRNAHVTEDVVTASSKDDRRKSRASSVIPASIVPMPPYLPRPQNHLCIAICGIICCAVPFGLMGLLCSLQVDSTYDDGDSESAECKSSLAKAFSMAAIVVGMLAFLAGSFYVIFYLLVPSIS